MHSEEWLFSFRQRLAECWARHKEADRKGATCSKNAFSILGSSKGRYRRSTHRVLVRLAEGTRYYNIDFFVGGKSKAIGDPIRNWHAKVGAPILELSQMKHQRQEA